MSQRQHQDKEVRFTALLHHVTVDLLRASYYALKRMFTPKPESDCGGNLLRFNGVCGVRAAFSA